MFGPKFGTRSGGLTPVWVLGDVERSTPSLEIVVTDAAQADVAIRVPRIRIRVEATGSAVCAIAPIATAYERAPTGVIHATVETPPGLNNLLSPRAYYGSDFAKHACGLPDALGVDEPPLSAVPKQRMDKPDLLVNAVHLALLAARSRLDYPIHQLPKRIFDPGRIPIALVARNPVKNRAEVFKKTLGLVQQDKTPLSRGKIRALDHRESQTPRRPKWPSASHGCAVV